MRIVVCTKYLQLVCEGCIGSTNVVVATNHNLTAWAWDLQHIWPNCVYSKDVVGLNNPHDNTTMEGLTTDFPTVCL